MPYVVAGKAAVGGLIVVVGESIYTGIGGQLVARVGRIDHLRVSVIRLEQQAVGIPLLGAYVDSVIPGLADIRRDNLHVAELRERPEYLCVARSQQVGGDLVDALGIGRRQIVPEG